VSGYLLDTNVLIWIATDRSRIKRSALDTLLEAPLFASMASPIEMAIKLGLGKLALPAPFETDFSGAIRSLLERSAIDLLNLDLATVDHLRRLPLHHRDPFDRIVIAQAFALGLAVATSDSAFFAYDGLTILDVRP
jgi:PIN domain nuclease of toxin-antitoxin system